MSPSRVSISRRLLEICFLADTGQARKKSTKINFLGPETAGWGGGLPLEGVVVEKFVPSLESLSSLGFEGRSLGCPGKSAGMLRTPRGVQKVCAKEACAHFLEPKGYVFRPPGLDLKGVQQYFSNPTLTVLLTLPQKPMPYPKHLLRLIYVLRSPA